MAVSSNKGTIHIFSLGSIIKILKENEKTKKNNQNKINETKEANNDNKNIFNEDDIQNEEKLPENSKTFFGFSQIEKSFAKIRLKPQKNICTFINNNTLIIISYDKKLYKVEIDTKKGGNCKLIHEKIFK